MAAHDHIAHVKMARTKNWTINEVLDIVFLFLFKMIRVAFEEPCRSLYWFVLMFDKKRQMDACLRW